MKDDQPLRVGCTSASRNYVCISEDEMLIAKVVFAECRGFDHSCSNVIPQEYREGQKVAFLCAADRGSGGNMVRAQ